MIDLEIKDTNGAPEGRVATITIDDLLTGLISLVGGHSVIFVNKTPVVTINVSSIKSSNCWTRNPLINIDNH